MPNSLSPVSMKAPKKKSNGIGDMLGNALSFGVGLGLDSLVPGLGSAVTSGLGGGGNSGGEGTQISPVVEDRQAGTKTQEVVEEKGPVDVNLDPNYEDGQLFDVNSRQGQRDPLVALPSDVPDPHIDIEDGQLNYSGWMERAKDDYLKETGMNEDFLQTEKGQSLFNDYINQILHFGR